MALVHIPTPLRSLTGGASKVTVAGSSVRAIVDALEAVYPGIRARLVQDDRLRQGLAVFVDGANSRRRLRTKVAAGAVPDTDSPGLLVAATHNQHVVNLHLLRRLNLGIDPFIVGVDGRGAGRLA